MSTPLSIANALFGKTQQAVLALLFGQPDRSFYMREVVAAAGTGASQVQKELDNLARAGLVRRERRGNQVWFQADMAAPVFEELKGLIVKTFGIRDVVRAALQPLQEKVRAAFIYGSIARGEDHAASDVDLFVVGDVLLSDLAPHLDEAERRLGRTISATLMGWREFSRRARAGEHFVAAVMKGRKLWLAGNAESLKVARG